MAYEWEISKGKYKLYVPELRCTLIIYEKPEGWCGVGKFEYANDRKTFVLEDIKPTADEAKNLIVSHLVTGLFDCQKNLLATLTTPLEEFK